VIPTEAEGDSSKEVEHVAFLCRENFLLTLHGDPIPILQRFATAKDTDAWLSKRSIAALVSAMLIAILTVLSAIFLPASFLVGFWGMNFDMPEMNLPYAYPAALGLLVLTGSSLFLYFRKNGWFD
jgi:magnesium transporter